MFPTCCLLWFIYTFMFFRLPICSRGLYEQLTHTTTNAGLIVLIARVQQE